MESEQDLVMRLQFQADTAAAEQAKKTLADLKREADASNKSNDDMNRKLAASGQVAGRAAEQIGTVAAAMGSAGGAASQAAAGVRLLAGSIQTMVTAGGGLAGLLAAITLLATSKLVTWLIDCSAETKRLNDEAGKTNDALTRMSRITLDAVVAQQAKMRAAASGTADEYERVVAARNRMLSAQEQADLAQLDLEKAQDLAGASKSDPFARRRIEAEYAARAAAVSQAADRARADNEVVVSDARVKQLRGQIGESQTEADRIAANKARQESLAEEIRRALNVTGLTDEQRGQLNQQLSDAVIQIGKLAQAIEAAQGRGLAARQQLGAAEMDALTARQLRAGLDIRGLAQGVEQGTARADLDYEQNEAAQAAARRLRDLERGARDRREREADLQGRFIDEASDVRAIDNGGKGDRSKEIRERDAALKELQNFRRDSAEAWQEFRLEIEKCREAIRNNPSQNT